MKKLLPYLLGAVALAALLFLVLGTSVSRQRVMDETITLRQRDKIPYGTYAAKNLLPALFKNASIASDNSAPGYWDSIDMDKSNQAVFLVARYFDPEDRELQKIAQFISKGNYVFLISSGLSNSTTSFLKADYATHPFSAYNDTLELQLNNPPFAGPSSFIYPGKKNDAYFTDYDTARAVPLGRTIYGSINFIQLQSGSGRFFVHLAPLAFSNYFLLHKKNIRFFQKAVSLIPPQVDKVIWNEYFLTKRRTPEKQPNILSVLWKYPSFKWALLMAIATLLVYVLLEMRRRQNYVPAWVKPANDSLDFVRTIGLLYYDKGDHQNLAKKMTAYFLDHVRSRYKISTQTLDDEFVQALHYKSSYPLEELHQLHLSIKHVNSGGSFTQNQLSQLYQQLESFYQKT